MYNLIAISLITIHPINYTGQASSALFRRYPDPASVSGDGKRNTVIPTPVVRLYLLQPIIEEHAT
ncbi:hypothetical protein E0I03_06530 [Dickeya dadantii]|uniref:hypothetical protein n=1 Tax=Dickeya dadantii TaxID=204038 RepID=UPI0014955090|nr:hypothetical protein [Dickeya dadantii]NPE50823.1 hypothetical protein [Dickeya dadantii]